MKNRKFMNSRGFTLIELLTAIILLSVIMTITAASVIGFIKNSKEKSYDILISNIKTSAQELFEECENTNILDSSLGEVCDNLIREEGNLCDADKCATMTVESLVEYGFLKSSDTDASGNAIVENPVTNDNINDCEVEVKKYVDDDYSSWYEISSASTDSSCPTFDSSDDSTASNSSSSTSTSSGTSTTNLVLSNLSTNSGTPSFSKTSCSSGCGEVTVGVYKTQDNLGNTYYFRGNAENNYVKFAGLYWRIVRVNGDGSIRIIYDGTSVHSNGTTTTDRAIGTSMYEEGYGAAGEETGEFGSSSDWNYSSSIVKASVDSWYKTNITDKGYSAYVVDAIYCNDVSLYSGDGDSEKSKSVAYNRIVTNQSPSLVCSSTSTSSVGLISADEVALAGGSTSGNNTSYYLYMGYNFWTETAYSVDISAGNGVPTLFSVTANGKISSTDMATNAYVRPVISLKASALTRGTGTITDPYTV